MIFECSWLILAHPPPLAPIRPLFNGNAGDAKDLSNPFSKEFGVAGGWGGPGGPGPGGATWFITAFLAPPGSSYLLSSSWLLFSSSYLLLSLLPPPVLLPSSWLLFGSPVLASYCYLHGIKLKPAREALYVFPEMAIRKCLAKAHVNLTGNLVKRRLDPARR